jgi:tetratricopeptide (TPR) repeat protein
MAKGRYKQAIAQLEYATDLDPQNGDYRAELAYCRFLLDPGVGAPGALDELDDTLRIEAGNGLALFYRGEVLRHMGRLDEAEQAYRQSITPLAPDRRPIDALRELELEFER